MKTLTALLLLASCVAAHADSQQTIKNANGQVIGRAVTNNVGTQFYNANGQNTGRSTTNSTGTTFYNSSGQMTGRSSGRK